MLVSRAMARAWDRCRSPRSHAPLAIASSDRWLSAMQAPIVPPAAWTSTTWSSKMTSARSGSPVIRYAIPRNSSADARHKLPAAMALAASSASARIWSAPSRHSSARSSASRGSIDELPPGTATAPRSAAPARRSASAGLPVMAGAIAARTATAV